MPRSTTFLVIILLLIFFITSCAQKSRKDKGIQKTVQTQKDKIPGTNKGYQEITVGSSPLSPLVADFNRDGYNDFAVVSHGESQLKIFWGRPDRRFVKGPVFGKDQVGYHPGKITIVDWNMDGLPDILLAGEGVFNVQLWQNTGNGFTKKAKIQVPINAVSIKCSDLDGDGDLDIVLGPHDGSSIAILWATGKDFAFETQIIKANKGAQNVEIADWNNDGKQDIFWVELYPGSAVVALNQGNRKFSKNYIKKPGKPTGVIKDGPAYIKLADLDGDGCQDAAVTLEVGKACYIYYGNCQGDIKKFDKIPAPAWGFSGLATVGFDSSHLPMLGLGEEMRLFIAKKGKEGWQMTEKPAGSLPRDFTFVDVDKDGDIDLIFSNTAGKTIGILYGPF